MAHFQSTGRLSGGRNCQVVVQMKSITLEFIDPGSIDDAAEQPGPGAYAGGLHSPGCGGGTRGRSSAQLLHRTRFEGTGMHDAQALLSSQALEQMLEACIAQGIEEAHEADLQELLVAALELSEQTGADLASALRMLCRLAATSADQSSHAQQLAQQVLHLAMRI